MEISELSSLLRIGLVVMGIACIAIGAIRIMIIWKKKESKLAYIKVFVKYLLCAILCFAGSHIISNEMDRTGAIVEAKHPISIDHITYGQAFDAYLTNVEWFRVSAKYTDNGKDVIQMNADCEYEGEEREITMQFRFNGSMVTYDENTSFRISFVGFDETEEVSVADMQDIVYEMFLKYASDHDMDLDESVKYGILYSEGCELTEEEQLALEDGEGDFDEEEYEEEESYGDSPVQTGRIVPLEDYVSYSQTADEMVDALSMAGLPVYYWEEDDSFGSDDGCLSIMNTDAGGCRINISYSENLLYSVCGINPDMSLYEADEILLANGAVDATRPDDTAAWRYTIDGKYSLTIYGSYNDTIDISFDCFLDDLTSW